MMGELLRIILAFFLINVALLLISLPIMFINYFAIAYME